LVRHPQPEVTLPDVDGGKSYNPAASRFTEASAETMRENIAIELARSAAGFLLPSRCLACRHADVDRFFRGGVCQGCWESLPAPEDGRCDRCDETLPGAPAAARCGRCLLDPPAFERLAAAAPYRGSAREILLAFKFRGADYLGPRIANEMLRRLTPPACGEVVAVPATARAARERGFHPAAVLAHAVARALGASLSPRRLVKTRETEVQSRVPARRRAANVRRAFRVEGRPAGRVLLVDDVTTSGATARECARRLVDAGAPSVTVWCFARASRADLARESA
jgi:predicted amidophosphoribosyltransferase